MNQPLLTIATITRHRPAFVRQLAQQVIQAADRFDPSGDLIRYSISDSSNDDQTLSELEPLVRLSRGRLTVRKATVSFDTAEAHLYDLLKTVEGRYVWTLADDEILAPDPFFHIFELIGEFSPDVIVVNPPMVSFDGRTLVHQNYVDESLIDIRGLDAALPYGDIVRRTGLIHLPSMMSAIVCNRGKLMSAKWDYYLSNHVIYAHAMAQLEAFVRSPAVFTKRDIFSYRMDAPETNNMDEFRKVSAARGFKRGYFWCSSLAIYLNWAIEQSILLPSDLIALNEIYWDKIKFPLLNYITDRFRDQIIFGEITQDDIRAMSLLLKYLPAKLQKRFSEMIALAEMPAPDANEVEALRDTIAGSVIRLARQPFITRLRSLKTAALNGVLGPFTIEHLRHPFAASKDE